MIRTVGFFAEYKPLRWETPDEGVSVKDGKHRVSKEIDQREQLLLAAVSGNYEMIGKIASNGKIDLKSSNTCFDATALFLAVSFGHFDALKALVEHGTSVTKASRLTGSTLLHEATKRNSLEMVRFLIDNGVDVEEKDSRGLTAWAANLDKDHFKGESQQSSD